jgi:hypothetical protein
VKFREYNGLTGQPNSNEMDGPFILYQSSIPNLSLEQIKCNLHTGSDYYCILKIDEKCYSRFVNFLFFFAFLGLKILNTILNFIYLFF